MRVLIVDDYEIVRRGVRSLLSICPECDICGEAVNGQDAIEKTGQLNPDVIVMDISMPKLNGLEATRQIRHRFPQTEVLMLSQHESEEMVRQAFNAGARGYVVKGSIARDLVTAVETVSRHQPFFDASVSVPEPPPASLHPQQILQRSAAIEQALRESEELYRSTFELAAVGVAHLSLDGKFLRANKKLGEILGYSPAALLKLRYQDVTHPADLKAEKAEFEAVRAGETEQSSSEKRYIRSDGSTVWVKSTVSSVHDAERKLKHFISVIEDITERKEAELARFRLAAIVESSDDAIVSKDLNGVISSWNSGAQQIFGYSAEEAVGKSITLIIPPELQVEEKEILRRLRAGERIEHFETVRVGKLGNRVDVSLSVSPIRDSRGTIVGASKIARDITERKRAEEALREQAKILDLAQVLVRDMDNRIVLWTRGTEKLYGIPASEALGCVSHELFQTSFPEPLAEIEKKLMETGAWEGELVHRKRDGSTVVVASKWVLHRDAHGRPVRILESNTDITERKDAELAQKELREQLEERVRERTHDFEEKNAELLRHTDLVRQLSARLLQSQDDERRRIARELHDSAGQIIAALQINLVPLEERVKTLGPEPARRLHESIDLVTQLSNELRTISHLLHPPLLDEAGLASALRWYVGGYAERSKIAVDLQLAPDLGRLSREIEIAIFRMVQECLTNIHRHSGSPSATIRVDRFPREVRVEVSDQGKGIRLGPRSLPLRPGVGIQGMQERIHQLGGRLEINGETKGTAVVALIPIQEASDTSTEPSPVENGIAV